MNIAFDIGGIPGFRGGGIERVIVQLFQTMSRRFPEDQFYIFDLFGEYAFAESVKGKNVHYFYFFPGKNSDLRKYKGKFQELLGALVRSFTKENRIDVFYVPAPFLATPDIGQNAVYQPQWFEKTAVVVQLYDIIPYLMREKYLPAKRDYERYMDCAQQLRWSDKIVAISKSARDDAVDAFGLDREKIDLVYLGCSGEFHKIEITEEEKASLYAQLDISKPFLMCSASVDERKNVTATIEAFSMLKETLRAKYQLVIVGRVSDEAREQYLKLAQKKRIMDNVRFTGFVTKEQLVQLYNLAELLVFPSLYEGFGIPVLEAWACGTAVAASNNSGLGEVVGQAGLTFDPKNPADQARTLEYALTSADLNALARQGEERLRTFTWERAADKTMEAFRCASRDRLKTVAEKRKKLLCVFLSDAPLPPAWKVVLSKLAQQTELTVAVQNTEDEWAPKITLLNWNELQRIISKIDAQTVYIAPDQICANAYFLMKQHPGKWLVMDQALDELILWISGLAEDGVSEIYGLAQKIRQYIDRNEAEQFQETDFLPYLTGVIAVGSEKRIQLSEHILKLPVYDIHPGMKRGQGMAELEEEAAQCAFENLRDALCEGELIADRATLVSCCEQEVREQHYSKAELRAFSKTIGTALGTGPSMRRIPQSMFSGKPKVAMVSSWNMKCGIAEFTKYYIEASEEKAEYRIYPYQTDNLLGPEDEITKERLWTPKGPLDQLISVLSHSDEDVVHLQYTEGFFEVKELCKLAQTLPQRKKIVATCHNTAFIQVKDQWERDCLNRIRFVVHQEKDRKHLLQQGLEHIILAPLGQPSAPKRDIRTVCSALGIKASPVIGSYGFFLPHKGIAKTIQAVAILKKTWPEILYIPCCSFFHVKEASFPYYQECLEIVNSLGLESNVRFVTDFLKPEESILLLQSCDILVSAYEPTLESASGSIRFCLAARRPVVTTREPIFKEFADCTIQISNNAPSNIAQTIENVIRQDASQQLVERMEHRLKTTSWPVITQQYMELYREKG